MLSESQHRAFHEDGYVAVPGLFSDEQISTLHEIARADRALAQAGAMKDGSGGESKIWLSTELKQDMYSAFAHSRRVVEPLEQLFGEQIMHFHHKMMLKEPRVGGAWEWHQDYGYWYNDGFLYPDMVSCLIAVDKADQENGCLQVLRGSHKLGRIDHGKVGGQTGADAERVAVIADRLELVYCELEPGTALFFHANTLHRSDQNRSERSRWSLICCYTTASNRSYKEAERPFTRVKPVEKWADEKILEIGRTQLETMRATSS